MEPVEEKRRMAEKIGASFTIDPVHQDVIRTAPKENGVEHVHCVIETCGRKDTSEQAMDVVDKHGTVVLFAVTAVDLPPWSFPPTSCSRRS